MSIKPRMKMQYRRTSFQLNKKQSLQNNILGIMVIFLIHCFFGELSKQKKSKKKKKKKNS